MRRITLKTRRFQRSLQRPETNRTCSFDKKPGVKIAVVTRYMHEPAIKRIEQFAELCAPGNRIEADLIALIEEHEIAQADRIGMNRAGLRVMLPGEAGDRCRGLGAKHGKRILPQLHRLVVWQGHGAILIGHKNQRIVAH